VVNGSKPLAMDGRSGKPKGLALLYGAVSWKESSPVGCGKAALPSGERTGNVDVMPPIAPTRRPATCAALAIALWALQAVTGHAQLDPGRAIVEKFENGLTLILLEERSLPSVSVQMLYRVGAKDEYYGITGVAHFLEHMAFRASANFPDTEVVSRIYAAGGEWHGYTWIDQTAYYATVPGAELDLLLRIEADRMTRMTIDPSLVEPERGAILAEMHGYENDPASVLHDAVVFTALQAHPYRNNTIGWESDIRAMRHEDLVAFYRQHYVPANAVLAVVGDIDPVAVRGRVQQLFGDAPAAPATPLPRTVEPPQNGERRIELLGAGAQARFEVAWQAPGVNHPDFPAFLVLQEWLGGGSGVNFIQTFATTPVRAGSLLDGLAGDVRTWFPPSAQTYVFTIAATLPEGMQPAALEAAVEEAVAALRETTAGAAQLSRLKARVLDELVYDIETHEDAAHQLAFFDGLGAPALLQALPAQVAAIEAGALQAAARRWLQPHQRTIGWYRAGSKPETRAPAPAPPVDVVGETVRHAPGARSSKDGVRTTAGGIEAPVVSLLDSGLPIIVQRSGLSPTVQVRVVLNSVAITGAGAAERVNHDPVWGVASLVARCRPDQLPETLEALSLALRQLQPESAAGPEVDDPVARLEDLYGEVLGDRPAAVAQEPAAAVLVAIAGAVDAAAASAEAARYFAQTRHGPLSPRPLFRPIEHDVRVRLPLDRGQSQIGYAVTAPLPDSAAYLPWRALLYVLTHGYEGRLGKEAISRRGLAYYVDGQYRSDGRRAWVAVSTGVDPGKLDDLEALYRAELSGLAERPPTESEVAEARAHFIGRLATERQSNSELTGGLAEAWLWWGRIPAAEEQRAAVEAITRAAVLQQVPAFQAGRIAIVEVGNTSGTVTN
jgi:predicted Zn-dependent peptidase